VQEPGGDDLVWLAIAAQQPTDFDRRHDGRRVVDLPVPIRVTRRGKPQRRPRDRQLCERLGGARQSGGRATGELIVEEALGMFSDHPHRIVVVSGSEGPAVLG
jgi:hypothetical protein